jgi:hypothetical protein
VNALRSALGALVLICVLADASACIVAFPSAAPELGVVGISALCPCGCKAHTGSLGGIGLTQLAAAPAEISLPVAERPVIAPAAPKVPPAAPTTEIDHVPIRLA